MSGLLAPITLELRRHLKKHLKGWIIDPLLLDLGFQGTGHGGLRFLRPLGSSVKFYEDGDEKGLVEQDSYLLCKYPNHQLRMLHLTIVGTTVPIRVFRITGWKPDYNSKTNWLPHHYDPTCRDRVFVFGNICFKRRLANNKSVPIKISIDLVDANGIEKTATTVAALLEHSHKKGYGIKKYGTEAITVWVNDSNCKQNDWEQ